MYQGRTAAESGLIFGHENMGIVTEIGSGVTLLQKGDRVVLPFNVADGRCRNCEEGKTAFCTGVNPGFAGGAYGYVAMGPYQGGQAQFLRVPYADFNALKLPPGTEHEADFALLADIFPTGWHGLVLSGFQAGESVAVFGAGPVGLMAAYSGVLRGASKVYVVDQVKERLDAAKKIGCIPVNFTEGDPAEKIIELNGGMVDRAVDAVGYQAVDKSGNKEQPNIVLDQLIKVTRPTGGLGIPGLYVPSVSLSLLNKPRAVADSIQGPWCARRAERKGTNPHLLWQAVRKGMCPQALLLALTILISFRVSTSVQDSATSRHTIAICVT